jgi:integrase
VAAGAVADGKAKYPGLHALCHFYGSWRTERGGLELLLKDVQLGHAPIKMTLDVYGRLLPKTAATATEAAERAFLGTTG